MQYTLTENVERSADLSARFGTLASEWRRATAKFSVLEQRYSHATYQEILTMGEAAVPFILNELKERPDWWFVALSVLSKENPATSAKNFKQAVEAWLKWGNKRGFVRQAS